MKKTFNNWLRFLNSKEATIEYYADIPTSKRGRILTDEPHFVIIYITGIYTCIPKTSITNIIYHE